MLTWLVPRCNVSLKNNLYHLNFSTLCVTLLDSQAIKFNLISDQSGEFLGLHDFVGSLCLVGHHKTACTEIKLYTSGLSGL